MQQITSKSTEIIFWTAPTLQLFSFIRNKNSNFPLNHQGLPRCYTISDLSMCDHPGQLRVYWYLSLLGRLFYSISMSVKEFRQKCSDLVPMFQSHCSIIIVRWRTECRIQEMVKIKPIPVTKSSQKSHRMINNFDLDRSKSWVTTYSEIR